MILFSFWLHFFKYYKHTIQLKTKHSSRGERVSYVTCLRLCQLTAFKCWSFIKLTPTQIHNIQQSEYKLNRQNAKRLLYILRQTRQCSTIKTNRQHQKLNQCKMILQQYCLPCSIAVSPILLVGHLMIYGQNSGLQMNTYYHGGDDKYCPHYLYMNCLSQNLNYNRL